MIGVPRAVRGCAAAAQGGPRGYPLPPGCGPCLRGHPPCEARTVHAWRVAKQTRLHTEETGGIVGGPSCEKRTVQLWHSIAKGSGRIIGMPLPVRYTLCMAYRTGKAEGEYWHSLLCDTNHTSICAKLHVYMRHRTGRGVCSMPGLASIDSPLTEVAPTVGPPYRAPIPRIERCHTQTVCGYLT
jgi:hypothetical protein